MNAQPIVITLAEVTENPRAGEWGSVVAQLEEQTDEWWQMVKLSGYWLLYRGTREQAAAAEPYALPPLAIQRRGKLSTAIALASGRPVTFQAR